MRDNEVQMKTDSISFPLSHVSHVSLNSFLSPSLIRPLHYKYAQRQMVNHLRSLLVLQEEFYSYSRTVGRAHTV